MRRGRWRWRRRRRGRRGTRGKSAVGLRPTVKNVGVLFPQGFFGLELFKWVLV
jgi:hypothetical protein